MDKRYAIYIYDKNIGLINDRKNKTMQLLDITGIIGSVKKLQVRQY